MICEICFQQITSKEYLEHLYSSHPEYKEDFIDASSNYNLFMESESDYTVNKDTSIRNWEPKEFKLEATSMWSFKNRGNWATHNGKYRGNWSPYIPRNLILRYTEENDVVLDPFLGSGTTLIETKLLKRFGVGIDINPQSIKLAKENLEFNKNNEYDPKIYNLDSRNIELIKDGCIDLICAHPPYANIIKYSDNIDGDLSLLDVDEFLDEIYKVANEMFRVLKSNKYCAILIGDTRRNKHIIPLGFKTMEQFLKAGFVLKETVIKEQHNCQATGFWYQRSIDYNFLLIAHEYLFVFRKP